jgi:magnesium transporter
MADAPCVKRDACSHLGRPGSSYPFRFTSGMRGGRKPQLAVYTPLMQFRATSRVSLTALLGIPVTDAQGQLRGRLKDIAVATGPEAGRVAGLVLKSRSGLSIVPSHEVIETPAGTLELRTASALVPLKDEGIYLFLQRDLVDRQIIDINGRKVVRVNDVDLEWTGQGETHLLRVVEVEVGLRGAFRRVFKGLLPRASLESLSRKFRYKGIPWHFVDVIEVDPARRVKLRIEHERLADMHPSDLAEILEDLAPAERDAVFTSLDEEVAAETLEEVDPKLQKSLLEKLDEERIADIVEEMDPGAAADLLAELPEEQSDAILEEMEPEERQEVSELLEFDEKSAAGAMTTDFVAVNVNATVANAVQALRSFDGDPESVTEIYLLDEKRVLRGAIPLARLVMAQPETRLAVLAEPRVLSCPADMRQNDLAEFFDKYNLHALAVVDSQNRMVGVVQADHVISFLREKL